MKKFFCGKRTKQFVSLALSGALILCQGMSLLADTNVPASSAQLTVQETTDAVEESTEKENAAAGSAAEDSSPEGVTEEAALSAADNAAQETKASDADLTKDETSASGTEEEYVPTTAEDGDKATDAGIPLIDDLTQADTQSSPAGVANTLSYEDSSAIFTVSYGEDAGLPADTELTVETYGHDSASYKNVYALADSEAKKLEANSEINFAEFYAVSLSYTDENGEEVTVKPDDFDYTITAEYPDNSAAVADTDTVRGFSFHNKKAAVLDATAEREGGSLHTISAKVHGSHVFGVISTEILDLKALQFENDDLRVSLDYTERSGIPDGAELLVEPIGSEDERYGDAQERIAGELLGGIDYFQLYDISIRKDGEEIEPAEQVTVKIVHKDDQTVSSGAEMQILHLQDDGGIDKLSAETNERAVLSPVRRLMSFLRRADAATGADLDGGQTDTASGTSGKKKFSTISFRTDSFSLYAEVGVLTTTLVTGGSSYTITATFGPEAEIPAGTQLVAKEILSGTEDYNSYLSRSEAQMSDAGISTARFFDISFVRNGKEIEPESRVSVKITLNDGLDVPDGAEVKAIHFAKENDAAAAGAEETEPETIAETISGLIAEATGTVSDFLTGTGDAGTDDTAVSDTEPAGTETPELLEVDTDADDAGAVTEVSFTQDSFSVTGVVVTQKTSAGWPAEDGEYVVLLSYSNNYYALGYDGTLMQVSVEDGKANFASTVTKIDDLKGYLWTWTSSESTLSNSAGVNTVYIDPLADGGISDSKPVASSSFWSSTSALQLSNGKLFRTRNRRARYLGIDQTGARASVTITSSSEASVLTFVNQITANTDQSPQDPGGSSQLDAPVAAKTLTDNENGTYDLSLSITGQSQSTSESSKADVVVILDRSNSMADYVSGSWTTRLRVAKNAVYALTDSLMANNSAQNPEAVRMSLITFGSFASSATSWTTSADTFKNTVEQVRCSGATNWEDALQKAAEVTTREGAEKYIIFVSDGNPTYYVGGGTGYEMGENCSNCYFFAKDDAYALVQSGFHFYTIGVFGSVDRM
jgi:hypothetical protein